MSKHVPDSTPETSAGRPASPVMPSADGLRDTIESIVVAFIFAFVFRAFIVEAFVIPTGSMAPTLYGQHDQYRCRCCHYPFAFGVREEWLWNAPTGQEPKHRVRCPNCSYEDPSGEIIRKIDPAQADSGDRILVLKWPYDLGIPSLGPQRWDVVVFKDPQNGDMNFIKRLLGLPGEVLEIINGDIYAAPVASLSEALRQALAQPRPRQGPMLPPELRTELDGKLRIQRKTPTAQASLWMLHYDHDYQPDLSPEFRGRSNPPLWQPKLRVPGRESPWDARTPSVTFRPTDDETHGLYLSGKPVHDAYGYNPPQIDKAEDEVAVGDVRLSFVLIPKADRGQLTLSLARGPDRFDCTIEAAGRVTLRRTTQGGFAKELQSGTIRSLRAGEPLRVAFENVDFRVTLRIDDETIVATDDKQYAPDVTRLRGGGDGFENAAAVELSAQSLALDLRHLAVHRDVFYRSVSLQFDGGARGVARGSFGDGAGWGTTNHPILLRPRPRDYYCCGDNSPQSKDSRLWYEVAPYLTQEDRLASLGPYQYGTVPGDQMIGRAFFVYWPAGIRLTPGSIGFIPNVGRMRFIR